MGNGKQVSLFFTFSDGSAAVVETLTRILGKTACELSQAADSYYMERGYGDAEVLIEASQRIYNELNSLHKRLAVKGIEEEGF